MASMAVRGPGATETACRARTRYELWVPKTMSPHATWAYSWIRLPSRSRRSTRTHALSAGESVRPAGGFWVSARCGRWVLW